jgi:hypothetical protein
MSEPEQTPTTQTECESMGGTWNAESGTCSFPKEKVSQPTDAEVLRDNEMLRARVKVLEDHLREAITIANKANDAQQARNDAERKDLIKRIVIDSNNKWNEKELTGKSLSDLKLINTTLTKNQDATFASIAAMQAEIDRKQKPQLTLGYYDSQTKSWKGGN